MKRCSDPRCPYGLEAYSERPENRGLCLNCLDDERRDLEQFHMDRDDFEAMLGKWRDILRPGDANG